MRTVPSPVTARRRPSPIVTVLLTDGSNVSNHSRCGQSWCDAPESTSQSDAKFVGAAFDNRAEVNGMMVSSAATQATPSVWEVDTFADDLPVGWPLLPLLVLVLLLLVLLE